ncbi:MAG TPA: non-heme iron oxygenase ferredoxin subunit [Candidatus Bathyarchaeia archaeon]|nr:non-heme iron oxygenase ferredoxin subunit [Candidatus Bathyarchaeia archaeon]
MLGTLVNVGAVSELPPGMMKGVEYEGRRILIVNLDGKLHAWDGTCTHEEADLSTGFLIGEEVTCPLHLSRFNLLTGEAVNPPAEKPLRKYDVKVENGEVFVDVD